MKIQKFTLAFLAAIGLLCLQTSAVAGDESKNQFQPPPAMAYQADIAYQADSCDPDVAGERVRQKASALSETVCASSDIANGDGTGTFSKGQKDFYANQCERTKEWVNDSNTASTIAAVGQGNKNNDSCYIVELENDVDANGNPIGDDDGICTQNEKIKGGCSVSTEEDKNEDGICSEISLISDVKGKKTKTWEACEEVCTVTVEEAGDDCKQLENMEGILEDANTGLASLNIQTTVKLEELAQQQGVYSEIVAHNYQTPELCNNLKQVSITSATIGPYSNYTGADRPSTFTEATDRNFWNEKLTLASNLCTDVAGTNYFGTNALFLCALPHIGQYVASDLLSSMSLLDDEITTTRIDSYGLCMQQMDDAIKELNTQLTSANNDIDQLNVKLDTIILLLNTPAGRREAFPTK